MGITKTKSAKVNTGAKAKTKGKTVASPAAATFKLGQWVRDADNEVEGKIIHIGREGHITIEAGDGCVFTNRSAEYDLLADVAPEPASEVEAPPKLPKIRPGLVFVDDQCGYGSGIVVNVVGEDIYVIHSDGTANVFQESEVVGYLETEGRVVGDFFDSVADIIAAQLFPLHGSTAPFAPHKGSRIPVMPTSEGEDFLAQLLNIAGLKGDSVWNSGEVIEELTHVRNKADRGIELITGLWKIIATTGVEDDSQEPKEVLARVGADYAELIAWREFAKRASGFLPVGPAPYSDLHNPEVLEKRIYSAVSEIRAADAALIASKLNAIDPYTTVAIKIDEIIAGSGEDMREWDEDDDAIDIFERAHALRKSLTEHALRFWTPRKLKRAADVLSPA